jgi:hypothetical protein
VHQEKQVWEMFLSPGGPSMHFFSLTPEGSSYLCVWFVSCIVHSKFDVLSVDNPEWPFPFISSTFAFVRARSPPPGEFWVS